ncbi:type 1 fimbrial protein [Acinetobacter sp. I-MWF]|uniref:fimbrial protein n=1 Tax=Acinetobacter sp. I-MWF TaxID=2940517 RepID=UPI0021C6CF90|nr:type 1 fimbrial protein [Acinetobacter sp. I-MWF]MCT9979083.1 type 1 fimbrial protein [Acinetobacter sp. I-MWF]
MKKLTLATLSTLALTLSCTNVFALDGTITVNGAVTDQTCVLLASPIGGNATNGLKDITVNIPALPKSRFIPNQWVWIESFNLYLRNATGTANCDAATSKAFKGIHLSAISPDHLDTADKTLLVNQASGASKENPVFIQILTAPAAIYVPVDLSAPWEGQVKGQVFRGSNNETYLVYGVGVSSKTGIVDAQNYTATVNYTIHYN